jgi:hypothetical protein
MQMKFIIAKQITNMKLGIIFLCVFKLIFTTKITHVKAVDLNWTVYVLHQVLIPF